MLTPRPEPQMEHPPKTSLLYLLIFFSTVVVVISAAVMLSRSSGLGEQRSATPAAAGPIMSFQQALEDPLEDAARMSLPEARRKVPYEIKLPSHDLANEDILKDLWVSRAKDAQVAQRFSTDVLIVLGRPDFEDPLTEFTGLISSGSAKNGRLDTVRDHPALVMEPDTDALAQNPASLQFVLDGVSITLYAAELTGIELKEIAETIE